MVEIGVIGGDGIGPEVVRAGMKVLEAAAMEDPSLELGFTEFPWGCEYYLKHLHLANRGPTDIQADLRLLPNLHSQPRLTVEIQPTPCRRFLGPVG